MSLSEMNFGGVRVKTGCEEKMFQKPERRTVQGGCLKHVCTTRQGASYAPVPEIVGRDVVRWLIRGGALQMLSRDAD
ncbi:MAG: hypothetical protein ACI9U2_000162 [Bradymonadia bacterium]|jgi:hypothetical protein